MSRVVVITPDDVAPGFALTGIHQKIPAGESLWEVVTDLCRTDGVGLIAIDSRLLQPEDEGRMQRLAEGWSGVLLTLPPPVGGGREDGDELQRLVQRALGYHVRLEGD